jgi:multidrug transporter EmrE-like cation transporter
LLVLNVIFNILANAGFKFSAMSPNWKGLLAWQVVGNLAGFLTVITLTGLLKHTPLHVAFPLTTGLAIIGVQLVAAKFLFHETITTTQWLGTLLIVGGIFLLR